MSVLDINNVLVPAQGLVGPPNLMVGSVTLTGDGTAGTIQIGFDLEEGLMWMPLALSFRTNLGNLDEFAYFIQFLDKNVAPLELTESLVRPVQSATEQRFAFVIPRIIFRSTFVAAGMTRIHGSCLNAVAKTLTLSFWGLSWAQNEFPSNWLAFFTAPP